MSNHPIEKLISLPSNKSNTMNSLCFGRGCLLLIVSDVAQYHSAPYHSVHLHGLLLRHLVRPRFNSQQREFEQLLQLLM